MKSSNNYGIVAGFDSWSKDKLNYKQTYQMDKIRLAE